jgi:hypothetical protein
MLFATLGEIQLGHDGSLNSPVSLSESLTNTVHEHKVLRGKPIPQRAGEELDKLTFGFHFDESFCDPATQYRRLKAQRSSGIPMSLIFGDGTYEGKSYWITALNPTIMKTTPNGRIVRFEATMNLIEVPTSSLTFVGSGIGDITRAFFSPLIKRIRS